MNKCKICGTETTNKQYCSMKCRDVGRHNNSWIHGKCKTCGTEIVYRKCKPKKFCSTQCASQDADIRVARSLSNRGKCINVEKIKATNRRKYGVDWTFQADVVKAKIQESNLQRFGVQYPTQSPEIIAKQKTTMLQKYGGYPMESSSSLHASTVATTIQRYGTENATQNANVRSRTRETNLKRYGVDTPLRDTEKMKLAMLNKYGVSNISKTPENKAKVASSHKNDFLDRLFNGDRIGSLVSPMFLASDYIDSGWSNEYPFKCNTCGMEFSDNLYSGHVPICPQCFPRIKSIGQKEVVDFISSLGFDVETDNRTVLDGLEIDIYIPEKHIGIEFDGVFWHSEISGNKDRKYHVNKTEACSGKGVKLLHIFDQEWNEKKPIIQSILRATFGKTPNRIYARKCEVRTVKNDECQAFLRENHIQGSDRSGVRLGLWYAGNLVAVMTFCKSRYDKSVQYEMSRFCCKLNTRIVGSASKLFSHFIRDYKPTSVVSYSDRRLFTGETYPAIGMLFCENTSPAYFYTKNGSIVGTRMTFQKHKLADILPKFDPHKSEWENMKDNGFDRIWDCGHLKYLWKQPTP